LLFWCSAGSGLPAIFYTVVLETASGSLSQSLLLPPNVQENEHRSQTHVRGVPSNSATSARLYGGSCPECGVWQGYRTAAQPARRTPAFPV